MSYAGAWLRRHYPAEFTCGLLNAQPMGFYTVATIVEDAKRHGLVLRPIDVMQSQWDCTLEPLLPDEQRPPDHPPRFPNVAFRAHTPFAIRMGVRFVKGLGAHEWQRIQAATAERPFRSLEDFVVRTDLNEKALTALAEAGAFECFGITRRQALWSTQGLVRATPVELPVDSEPLPAFEPLAPLETIAWDYTRARHSTHGHPLEPLRAALHAQGLPDARTLALGHHGERLRYAGLVICRQRPGTASGVTFMTLEDETGFVNAVVWRQVFEQYAVILKTESFLGITGKLQVERGVVHLIAEALWKPVLHARPASGGSRDFH